ncbi:MAG: hypothetical protein U1E73_10450 [Planctomycetota bacterium]
MALTTFAYLGPGGQLGAFVALLGSLVLAVLGLAWYPLKRRFDSRREQQQPGPAEPVEDPRP